MPSSAPPRLAQPLTLIQPISKTSPSTRPAERRCARRARGGRGRARGAARRARRCSCPGAGPPPCMIAKRKRFCPGAGGWGSARTIVRSVRSAELEAARRAAPSPRRSRRAFTHSATLRVCSTHCISGWRVTRLSFIPMSCGSLPGRRGQQLLDRGVAEQRAHVAVEGARRAAALDVAQDRDAHVLVQPLLQRPCGRARRVIGLPWRSRAPSATITIESRRPAWRPAAQALAHRRLPVVHVGRALRDQHAARAGGDRAHQRQVAAVAAHHLDHERALVAGGGAGDRVDRLGDAVQRRVGADRHVGARHVVVDRADQAHDAEAASRLRRGLARRRCRRRPARRRAPATPAAARSAPVRLPSPPITTRLSMPAFRKLLRRLQPSLARAEALASARCRSTVPPRWRMPPTADQVIGDDAVAAVDRALVALADREHALARGRAPCARRRAPPRSCRARRRRS